MMGKLLIVTALNKELKRILSKSTIRKLIVDGKVEAIVTGLGKETEKYIKKNEEKLNSYDFILNCGVCGSVSKKIGIFQEVEPEIFKFENKEVVKNKNGISIKTVENPVLKREEKLKINAQLIDMESFFIAEFCENNNIKFKCLKVVSDDLNIKDDLKSHFENITKALDILANHVEGIVTKLKSSR